ncbi:MAG: hypothetical protein ACAH59_07225 [Pseudobdellovibrionaceae bacterium]
MEFMATEFTMNGVHPHFQEDEFFHLGKKRILLIEEDWDFSQLLASLIRHHLDVEVEVVKNPYQALSRMTHDSFDVLVLDSKLNPYQALTEAENYMEPLLENSLIEIGKIPVIVLRDQEEDFTLQGLESHFFRIASSVVKDPKLERTVRGIESELNEILELS